MVKSSFVFYTLSLSRLADRERLCVSVRSEKSKKRKRERGRKTRRARRDYSSDAPSGDTRRSVTPWHNGTQLLTPWGPAPCQRQHLRQRPSRSVPVHTAQSAGPERSFANFQEESLRGLTHYTKPIKQTHRRRRSDIKGIIKAQESMYCTSIHRKWS